MGRKGLRTPNGPVHGPHFTSFGVTMQCPGDESGVPVSRFVRASPRILDRRRLAARVARGSVQWTEAPGQCSSRPGAVLILQSAMT